MARARCILIAALAVAGCTGAADVGETAGALAGVKGVDYAWGRPAPSVLASQGYKFAARYLSYDTSGKNLTASEAKSLIAAGLDVVSNWEYAADAALSGYNQGVKDAQNAESQASSCGAPADRPIYFSVDFDATPGQQTAINSYFDGVASVIGRQRTGAYGGYYVIQRLFDAGKISWGWQTYAWSGGQWDARAQLRQIQNGVTIDGVDSDVDQSTADDFGQWGHGPVNAIAQASENNVMAAVSWPDGHMELFPRAQSGARLHVWTTDGGDTWNTAGALDGDSACGATASFWGAPWSYPEVFSARGDGSTGHLWWASGWNKFQPFGGANLSHLSTLVWGDGRSEVFALGADGAIWHDYWDTSKSDWSGWSSMGGTFATGASTILWKDGHGELFAVDGNGTAWHDWTGANGWSGWTNMGGSLASRPVPARWSDGHVELFARGTDGHLQHSYLTFGKGWSDWEALDAATTIVGEPAVMVNAGGPEVFARDASGAVVHLWWNGSGWTNFVQLHPEPMASDPFAWIRQDGHGEVFAVDDGGNLLRSTRDAKNVWSAWTPIASGVDACTPRLAPPQTGGDDGGVGATGGGGGDDGGIDNGGTGGNGDTGTGDGTGSGGTPAMKSHGGCSFAPTPGGNGAFFVVALLASIALRRRVSGKMTK